MNKNVKREYNYAYKKLIPEKVAQFSPLKNVKVKFILLQALISAKFW
jgi:hypothetical protein